MIFVRQTSGKKVKYSGLTQRDSTGSPRTGDDVGISPTAALSLSKGELFCVSAGIFTFLQDFVNRKKFSSFLLTLPTPFDEYLFTERTARTSRQREVSPPFFSDNRHRERNMSC